jgi:lipoteichoic acid synthase
VQDYQAIVTSLRTRIPDNFDFFSPLHTNTPASYQDKNYSGIAAGQNVLLIILESTEREHINPQTTPNLFKLQQQAIIFTDYFTTSVNSLQANYAIFYSDHLSDYSVVGFPRQIYNGPLTTTSLPEVLHQAGYRTSVFFSGFLSYQDMGYLWNQKGVDDVYGAQEVLQMSGETGWVWGAFETQTVKVLGEWIKRDRTDPFLAVYKSVYPHHPYFTPVSNPPFPEDSWRNRFRNALHYVDQSVGLLLNYLDRTGMRSNTSIIVVGDHGETLDPARAGHGIRMDLAEIQVPLFIHNPNLFDRRIVRSVPANHLDLAPTIAGLLGIASSPDWLGRNLLSSSVSPRMLYVQRNYNNQQSAIVDGEMLYVRDDNAALEYMYNRGEESEKNLAKTPARLRLMKEYRNSARHFEDFVVLRHLERAYLYGGK